MAKSYLDSYVFEFSPRLYQEVVGVVKERDKNILSTDEIKFLLEAIKRKVPTTYKFGYTDVLAGNVELVYIPDRKVKLNLTPLFQENGKVKAVANIAPYFPNPEKIDNLQLLYRLTTEGSAMVRIQNNMNGFNSNKDIANFLMDLYNFIFTQIFGKITNLKVLPEETVNSSLPVAINYYVQAVLLDRSPILSLERATGKVKEVTTIDKDDLYTIKDLPSFLNMINTSVLTKTSVISPANFLKEYASLYPGLIFGIDNAQVMCSVLWGYYKSNSYDSTYIKLSKTFLKDKKKLAEFESGMSAVLK
jgi:hypothetical protein